MRLAVLFLLSMVFAACAAHGQQAVRIRVDGGPPGKKSEIPAELYRPAATPAPAVALFHGCGGVGVNIRRMAELLKSWGYVALVVDSFSSRGIRDACGLQKWPTQADAEKRALDIDAAARWLGEQAFVRSGQIGFMGYSYGGGVGVLRALSSEVDARPRSAWQASVLLYPDCALGEALGPKLRPRQPTLIAMGELDDWTPVPRCKALLDRIVADRQMVELRIYPGAHHSFDALGLPVRYLEGAGNRSKPNNCCGAHYGANEPAWKSFVADVKAFLARNLPP